jgi:hypothetical protein|tara:strand:- start:131 stop:295 length:165 start_codon:yes stop_codon:yes gene_type:complete
MKKRDSNKHRKDKKLFQAWLMPGQMSLIAQCKSKNGIKTDIDLLVTLAMRDLNK